jgi:hypothetical protein
VIVGAGQALRRVASGEDRPEPISLIVDAVRRAGENSGTGGGLLCRADSVRCVPVLPWRGAEP